MDKVVAHIHPMVRRARDDADLPFEVCQLPGPVAETRIRGDHQRSGT